MKKIILVLAILAFAAPSFAAIFGGADASTTEIGGADFKPSVLVTVDLEFAASEYAAGTKHTNGSKCYGSRNIDSTIDSFDGTVGTAGDDGMVTGSAVAMTDGTCP